MGRDPPPPRRRRERGGGVRRKSLLDYDDDGIDLLDIDDIMGLE